MDEPVLFGEIAATGGARIATATLNRPRALNALTLETVQQLLQRLGAWADDPDVVAVWLDAAGDRAFCAGADLQALHRAMVAQGDFPQQTPPALAADFFAAEYRLDHVIHHYPKPVIAWLGGYVMGGGLGLAHGASHRLVTEAATFAMPEVTIGLFPDVAASRFLGALPLRLGRFLGLTGTRLATADALACGLADLPLSSGVKTAAQAALATAAWRRDGRADRVAVSEALAPLADWSLAEGGEIAPRRARLATLCAAPSVADFAAALAAAARVDAWFAAAQRTFAAGAPSTAWLAWHLQDAARTLSLADTYRLEYDAAVGCCLWGDFAEGIRALLVDKDRQPRFRPATRDPGSAREVLEFLLRPRWHGQHPLADLVDPVERA